MFAKFNNNITDPLFDIALIAPTLNMEQILYNFHLSGIFQISELN